MKIYIDGYGDMTVFAPIPADILASGFPFASAEMYSREKLSVFITPYPEVYEESTIRQFLMTLLPFISYGVVNCEMSFISGGKTVLPAVKWKYEIDNGHIFKAEKSGTCIARECII